MLPAGSILCIATLMPALLLILTLFSYNQPKLNKKCT